MREYYNASRIVVTMEDDFTGEVYEQEMNHNTKPFSTQALADANTDREIQEWKRGKGESMYNTSLTIISWRRY